MKRSACILLSPISLVRSSLFLYRFFFSSLFPYALQLRAAGSKHHEEALRTLMWPLYKQAQHSLASAPPVAEYYGRDLFMEEELTVPLSVADRVTTTTSQMPPSPRASVRQAPI